MKNYKSKYSNISYEEFKRIRRDNYERWLKSQTEETRQQYKNDLKGHCEICKKDLGNIYQHNKTKTHLEMVEKNAPLK
jgi:hypothetical protein